MVNKNPAKWPIFILILFLIISIFLLVFLALVYVMSEELVPVGVIILICSSPFVVLLFSPCKHYLSGLKEEIKNEKGDHNIMPIMQVNTILVASAAFLLGNMPYNMFLFTMPILFIISYLLLDIFFGFMSSKYENSFWKESFYLLFKIILLALIVLAFLMVIFRICSESPTLTKYVLEDLLNLSISSKPCKLVNISILAPINTLIPGPTNISICIQPPV